MTEPYGLPAGTAINYRALGFPAWVDDLCRQWGLDSSTYPGHQESDRPDIGAAPNPDHLNRGIDWAGPPEKMLDFAHWLKDQALQGGTRAPGVYGPPGIEMVIHQSPATGEQVTYPVWVDFSGDLPQHTDHVHTRFSAAPIMSTPAGPAQPIEPELSQQDRYALAVIREGQRRSISRRGICIALTVPYVESSWQMYANSNVGESLNYPHDAVGSDHDSTGLFQQRQAWGPLSCTMDAACSAGLFFDGGAGGQPGLRSLDYDSDRQSPGMFAADVQQPAAQYRDRYDQHWGEAQALYDRLAGFEEGGMGLSPEEHDKLFQVWGALFNPVPSKSRYADPNDLWATKDFPRNDDGFLYDLITEHDAALGDPAALARIQKAATAGDHIAAQWLANRTGTPPPTTPPVVVPPPVITPGGGTPPPVTPPPPAPPPAVKPVLYCANGFMGDMWQQMPADTARAVEDSYYFQPVGYDSGAFPLGIGRDSGVAELKRLIRADQARDPGRRFAFAGYSLGAVVVDDVFDALRSGDMQQFWPFFLGGVKWGDPRREMHVWSGGPKDPGGAGIAGTGNLKQTPANFRSYMYPQNGGDIYANAGLNMHGDYDLEVAEDMELVYNIIMENWDGALASILEEARELIGKRGTAALSIIMACVNGLKFLVSQQAPHGLYPIEDAVAFLRSLLAGATAAA